MSFDATHPRVVVLRSLAAALRLGVGALALGARVPGALLLGLLLVAATTGCASEQPAPAKPLSVSTDAGLTSAEKEAKLEADALAYARQYEAEHAGKGPASGVDLAAAEKARVMAAEAQRQLAAKAEAEAVAAKAAAELAAQSARDASGNGTAEAQAAALKAEAAAKVQNAAAAKALAEKQAQAEAAAKAAAVKAAAAGSAANTVSGTAGKAVAGVARADDYVGLVAEIQTSKGTMVMSFRPDKAPGHVKNFVDLSRKGFYDGLTFHRIIPGFMIQGGDPKADGSGGPGYQIKAEFNDLPHLRGTLSMARGGHPDSAGSQFFICHAVRPDLDGKYTVFGQLIKGLDTLDAIAAEGSIGGVPRETITITKVVIRPAQPDEKS